MPEITLNLLLVMALAMVALGVKLVDDKYIEGAPIVRLVKDASKWLVEFSV